MDVESIKEATVRHFVPPFTDWCDEIVMRVGDRKLAYTSLIDYLAHQMAGLAVEFDIEPDFAEAAELFGEVAQREFEKLNMEMLPF